MKSIFILASLIVLVFWATPDKAGAQSKQSTLPEITKVQNSKETPERKIEIKQELLRNP